VVRVALSRFLLLSFGTLVAVGGATSAVSQHLAMNEAIRDSTMDAWDLRYSIAEVLDRVERHPAQAPAELNQAMSEMIEGSVRPIALWDSHHRILWTDSSYEAGTVYDFPARLTAVAEQGGTVVMESGEAGPTPEVAPADDDLLAVYVGAKGSDGEPFMYEAHAPLPEVDEEAGVIFNDLLPMTLGALLLLQLANVPLALSLARRVDRAAEHRSMILHRSLRSWHDERRRLAQELHDGVIQDLSAMSYALPAVLAQLPDEPEADPARSIGERMTEALTQDLRALRSMLIDLVPADLDGRGLEGALETLAQRSGDRGLQVELSVGPDLEVGSAVAGLVYRVVREGLRNVEKHAEARTASVQVERLGDHVEILISDDGRGIQPRASADGHVGLRLLQEMVAEVGGSVQLRSGSGQGAQLRGVVPAVLADLDDETR
jgi:signal transduction histidine kinase